LEQYADRNAHVHRCTAPSRCSQLGHLVTRASCIADRSWRFPRKNATLAACEFPCRQTSLSPSKKKSILRSTVSLLPESFTVSSNDSQILYLRVAFCGDPLNMPSDCIYLARSLQRMLFRAKG